MSSYLYGPNNELLTEDRELRVINRFYAERVYWSTFYSVIMLNGSKDDIGEQINRAIEEGGGVGIVNVKITSEGYSDFIMNILPIWPSYSKVVVEGDIVKYAPFADNVQLLAEEVQVITEMTDTVDAVLNSLPNRCRAIDREDTLFASLNSWSCSTRYAGYEKHFWKTMSPAEKDGHFPHMLNFVKMKARGKGANVVQILHLTYDRDEISKKHKETPSAPPLPDFYPTVALDVRYWSCPVQNSR